MQFLKDNIYHMINYFQKLEEQSGNFSLLSNNYAPPSLFCFGLQDAQYYIW